MKTENRTPTVTARLVRLVGLTLGVMGIMAALSSHPQSQVKVNGSAYAPIVQQEDLLADTSAREGARALSLRAGRADSGEVLPIDGEFKDLWPAAKSRPQPS
jgi:hypothetical protein